jgi:hypothetical protein
LRPSWADFRFPALSWLPERSLCRRELLHVQADLRNQPGVPRWSTGRTGCRPLFAADRDFPGLVCSLKTAAFLRQNAIKMQSYFEPTTKAPLKIALSESQSDGASVGLHGCTPTNFPVSLQFFLVFG